MPATIAAASWLELWYTTKQRSKFLERPQRSKCWAHRSHVWAATTTREVVDDRSSRRTVLTIAAAAARSTTAPQVFAQAPQAAVPQGCGGPQVGFYEKGNVRIRYAEIGSGFPLLATPGGGLNSP